MARSQRRRILEAMVEVVAERGYPETRVVDIIERAGVSRKTFYELFADKEECFLAAYDHALGLLYRGTEMAFESATEKTWGWWSRDGASVLGDSGESPALLAKSN